MQRITRAVGGIVAVAITACSPPDGFQPTADTVAGSYAAISILVYDTTGVADWYAQGARIEIHLDPNGATFGHLFVPGAATGRSDENQDLTGTWVFYLNTVFFALTADTFIDQMDWSQPDRNRLFGHHVLPDGTRMRVVFGRFIS